MKTMHFIYVAVIVLSTKSQAQIKEEDLISLKQNINAVEKKFEKKDSINQKTIKILTEQNKSDAKIATRLAALEKKQEIYDQIALDQNIKERELIKLRYEGGVLVLKDMILLLDALKSQYTSINFQQSYNDLSNPNSYPEYGQNIEYLKKKLVKNGLVLPDIKLDNAILSTVYSIARSIASEQPDKTQKVKELVCVLDFTSQSYQNLIIVKHDLKYLEFNIDKMILNYRELFKSYSRSVGYNNDFDQYMADSNDHLKEMTNNYFESLKNKERTAQEKDLASLKFQLKKIIDAHLEYEIYIRQGLAYYEKFGLIMADLKPKCEQPSMNQKLLNEHKSVSDKLDNAKKDFEKAYKDKIKQSYIKQLNEG